MSEKALDKKKRWRCISIGFRASPEESKFIDEAVALSGLTKQDYIINKLLNREVVVAKSPKTFKALSDKMSEIISELKRIQSAGEVSDELAETIAYVTNIYYQNKED